MAPSWTLHQYPQPQCSKMTSLRPHDRFSKPPRRQQQCHRCQHRRGLTHPNRTPGCKCIHRQISRCSKRKRSDSGSRKTGGGGWIGCAAVKRAEGEAMGRCVGDRAGLLFLTLYWFCAGRPDQPVRMILTKDVFSAACIVHDLIFILTYLSISDSYNVSYLAFLPHSSSVPVSIFSSESSFVQCLDRRPCHC